jgi:hypothetical protein
LRALRVLVWLGVSLAVGGCKRHEHPILYPPPPVAQPPAPLPPPTTPSAVPQQPVLATSGTPPAPPLPAVAAECRGAHFDLDHLPASCWQHGHLEPNVTGIALGVVPDTADVRLGGDVELAVTLTNTSGGQAALEWDADCFPPQTKVCDDTGHRAAGATTASLLCNRDRTVELVLEPGGTATTRVRIRTLDRHDPTSLLKVLQQGSVPMGPYKRGNFAVHVVLPVATGGPDLWLVAKSKLSVR